ncbi:MAG: magnesium transporter [Thermoplasmata archaeon]
MDKRRVVLESLPFLLLGTMGGALAGMILGGMRDVLELLPGLIAIVPAIIGMRGNISASMGNRLGSAYHLGFLDEGITSNIAVQNLKSSTLLSLYVSSILPLFLLITNGLLGFHIDARILLALTLISVMTGLSSGVILSFLAFFIITLSIRYKIDPDNVTGPILSTVGDIFSLLLLFAYASLIGGAML